LTIAGGIPLQPGRYERRVEVEGFENATATESFVVIIGQPVAQPPT